MWMRKAHDARASTKEKSHARASLLTRQWTQVTCGMHKNTLWSTIEYNIHDHYMYMHVYDTKHNTLHLWNSDSAAKDSLCTSPRTDRPVAAFKYTLCCRESLLIKVRIHIYIYIYIYTVYVGNYVCMMICMWHRYMHTCMNTRPWYLCVYVRVDMETTMTVT